MKLTSLAAALLLIPAFSFSQNLFDGYIINQKGDTVKGQIRCSKKGHELFEKVFFQKSFSDKKFYTPDKIREFFVNGETYISREVDGDLSFIHVLSNGTVKLYEYRYEMQSGNEVTYRTDYYIEKSGSGTLTKVKSGKFKKIISEMMGDCSRLVQDVENKKYDIDNIREVVEQYNSWKRQGNG